MSKRFKKHQTEVLKSAFKESEYLNKERKLELARITGLDMEQVASSFNRMRSCKRATESSEHLKRSNAELEQSLQESHEREAKLQKELEESTSRVAQLETENQSLKHQIEIAERELHFDPLRNFY